MDITARLRGKRIAHVMTNGHILSIRTDDGAEVNIAWVDGEGRAIKGKPVAETFGARLVARGLQDLINHPAALLGVKP